MIKDKRDVFLGEKVVRTTGRRAAAVRTRTAGNLNQSKPKQNQVLNITSCITICNHLELSLEKSLRSQSRLHSTVDLVLNLDLKSRSQSRTTQSQSRAYCMPDIFYPQV